MGKKDVCFVRAMIVHHEMALDMSAVEMDEGSDPAVKAWAQEIFDGQSAAIKKWKKWLKANG